LKFQNFKFRFKIKFEYDSSPKISKLVKISSKTAKGAKNICGGERTDHIRMWDFSHGAPEV
jgi:hypothetical protein